jgi:hypothetical protein
MKMNNLASAYSAQKMAKKKQPKLPINNQAKPTDEELKKAIELLQKADQYAHGGEVEESSYAKENEEGAGTDISHNINAKKFSVNAPSVSQPNGSNLIGQERDDEHDKDLVNRILSMIRGKKKED